MLKEYTVITKVYSGKVKFSETGGRTSSAINLISNYQPINQTGHLTA